MTVYSALDKASELTDEQIAELDALRDRPIVYDEDAPELSDEMLSKFQNASVQISV